ncbi:nucleotide-binding universal stress UspA family protein [Paraburkholderia sp. 35.1]
MLSSKAINPDVEPTAHGGRAASTATYRRIFIGARGGHFPGALIDYASAWAGRETVLQVAAALARPAGEGTRLRDSGDARRTAEEILRTAQALLAMRGLNASTAPLALSHPDANSVHALAEAARRWGADLLLTDCAGPASLAREVHCPVLTLPAGGIGRCHVPPARIFASGSLRSHANRRRSRSSASRLCGMFAAGSMGQVKPRGCDSSAGARGR